MVTSPVKLPVTPLNPLLNTNRCPLSCPVNAPVTPSKRFAVTVVVALIAPTTSNATTGDVVPIPMFTLVTTNAGVELPAAKMIFFVSVRFVRTMSPTVDPELCCVADAATPNRPSSVVRPTDRYVFELVDPDNTVIRANCGWAVV